MVTNVQTITTEAGDTASKVIQTVQPPPIPNGTRQEDKLKTQIRSKYRHVAALHQDTRPSCLSHESKETPSFLGFRNLMVLTIIVMNLRLVVENARKYGLLIT